MLVTITKLRSSMIQAARCRRCLRLFLSFAAAIFFSAGCAHKKADSLLPITAADSSRTQAGRSPQSGGIEVIKLETGRVVFDFLRRGNQVFRPEDKKFFPVQGPRHGR